jgi:hypothetical protein
MTEVTDEHVQEAGLKWGQFRAWASAVGWGKYAADELVQMRMSHALAAIQLVARRERRSEREVLAEIAAVDTARLAALRKMGLTLEGRRKDGGAHYLRRDNERGCMPCFRGRPLFLDAMTYTEALAEIEPSSERATAGLANGLVESLLARARAAEERVEQAQERERKALRGAAVAERRVAEARAEAEVERDRAEDRIAEAGALVADVRRVAG